MLVRSHWLPLKNPPWLKSTATTPGAPSSMSQSVSTDTRSRSSSGSAPARSSVKVASSCSQASSRAFGSPVARAFLILV